MRPRVVALPLVVTAEEVIWSLVRGGFAVRHLDGVAVLERGSRVLRLPASGPLPPEVLTALLRDAGVPHQQFLELLSEVPTNPGVVRGSKRRP